MKLNVCMLFPLLYEPNMRVAPQIGICSYITRFGHEVTWVISSEKDCQPKQFFFSGVKVYVTPYHHYLPGDFILAKIFNHIPYAFKRMRLILKIFREEKYNLIFVREDVFDGLVAAYIIKRKYKVLFVFQLPNPIEQYWETYEAEPKSPKFLYYLVARFIGFIATRLLHESDLILPISKWLKDHLIEQGIKGSKIMPVSSGVDIEAFLNKEGKDIRKRYDLSNSKVIIYVGTLDKARGLKVLIQAFSKVKQKNEGVKLLVIGRGSDEQHLKRLATKLGIKNDVVFTGRVPQPEVPDFIASADIGVAPGPPLSFYKVGSPIKMFEYMAMAKPVVANEEIYEQKEVLEQSRGGILVPFTPEAFAKAIIELLDNPEKAAEMGRRGREWVVKNRNYEILARQVEKRYLELLNSEREKSTNYNRLYRG